MLSPATAASSLGAALGLGEVDEDELYAALDWLGERRPAIETALARRHLRNGTLVLYDVSSSYLEAVAGRWPSVATAVMASGAACRSSTACFVRRMAVQWRLRCLPATPLIR
jgi:hypothetical protein